MQHQSKNKNAPLLCTYKQCKALQIEDCEFCAKHAPKTEAETLTEQIINLRNDLAQEVSSSTMDLINQLVEAEIQLEALSNQ